MLRLYNMSASGNCYKVRLLLAQLGLEYETVPVEPHPAPRPPELAELNPAGRAPTLALEDGSALPESGAILWYLAEGTPFLPDGRRERAEVLAWMFFEQNLHEPNIATRRFWVHIHRDTSSVEPWLARWHEQGVSVLRTMERHLERHDWFACDRYTIADVALYGYTHVAPEGGFDLAPHPAIRAWLERVQAEPRHVAMSEL